MSATSRSRFRARRTHGVSLNVGEAPEDRPVRAALEWRQTRSALVAVDLALAAAARFRAANEAGGLESLVEHARDAHLAFGEAWERLFHLTQ